MIKRTAFCVHQTVHILRDLLPFQCRIGKSTQWFQSSRLQSLNHDQRIDRGDT